MLVLNILLIIYKNEIFLSFYDFGTSTYCDWCEKSMPVESGNIDRLLKFFKKKTPGGRNEITWAEDKVRIK